MASRTVSNARRLLQHVSDEVACRALITVAYHVARLDRKHPRVREFCQAVHAGYAWGLFLGGGAPRVTEIFPFVPRAKLELVPRDPTWEGVEARTAARAASLRHK
jgi:hypothetical protein